jgi:hypothetical protein
MLFDKNLTEEMFKEKCPELYNSIIEKSKNEGIKESQEKSKEIFDKKDKEMNSILRENKLLKMGHKMNKINKAMEFINTNKSYEVCLEELINAKEEISQSISEKVFQKTAPPIAGNSGTENEVTTFEEAKEFVKNKYSLTKISEIAKKARREFPELKI